MSGHSATQLIGYAALVAVVVIVTRIVWVFPSTYVPRWLFRRLRERDPYPPWQQPAFVAWAGMRGAVTLAAALAIPLRTNAGAAFSNRGLIVFLAFSVVLATLVVQGLSLPLVIRALGLEEDVQMELKEEAKARIRGAEAAIARLDELVDEDWVRAETAERMRGLYRFRINRFSGDGSIEQQSQAYQRLRRELLEAERHAIVALRNEGKISDEVMRHVERDLDLEDSRLDI